MTRIPVKPRDDFAGYLRKHGMIRRDSHRVARHPSAKWCFVRCGDGLIRACKNQAELDNFISNKARYVGHVRELFFIWWKEDPQPGPSVWMNSPFTPPWIHR